MNGLLPAKPAAPPFLYPEGPLDAWLDRVARRRRAESTLREVFLHSGYREIILPAVEEAEGSTPGGGGRGAYRFLDQEGRVWALRSDVTPGLARLVWSRDGEGARPRRLFYVAELYRRLQGETGPAGMVQVGAEVVGGRGPAEDAAILSLAATALGRLGMTEFRLVVGHVGLLKGALAEAGVGPEGCEQVLGALQARDYVRLQRNLAALGIPSGRADALGGLLTWRGDAETLLAGGPGLPSPLGGGAEEAWEDLHALLRACAVPGVLSVDLGLVRDRTYYTGMVFEISLPGLSQPAGGGGRYDCVLSPEPATGFAFDLDAVLSAAQGPTSPGWEALPVRAGVH